MLRWGLYNKKALSNSPSRISVFFRFGLRKSCTSGRVWKWRKVLLCEKKHVLPAHKARLINKPCCGNFSSLDRGISHWHSSARRRCLLPICGVTKWTFLVKEFSASYCDERWNEHLNVDKSGVWGLMSKVGQNIFRALLTSRRLLSSETVALFPSSSFFPCVRHEMSLMSCCVT